LHGFEDCTASKIARLRRLQDSAKIACAAGLQSSKIRAIYERGQQNILEIRCGRDNRENPKNPRDSIGAPAGIVS
jgi:hypothetical protein